MAQGMTKTVSIKYCQTCDAALQDRDRFCRRCGIRQSGGIHDSTSPINNEGGANLETRLMRSSGTVRTSPSRPLMRTLTQELAFRTSPLLGHRWTMHLISALVTVPLWLIIVLLSPIDAYFAARAISSTFELQAMKASYAQDHDS